jgi:hypothetical protein
MTSRETSLFLERLMMILGIPWVYLTLLAIAALAFGCCFCGCASAQNASLSTPMGAVGE